MRLFEINNICLNLDNIKQIHIMPITTYSKFGYTIYADDIPIFKKFKHQCDAIKQLEMIIECIKQGYSRF